MITRPPAQRNQKRHLCGS